MDEVINVLQNERACVIRASMPFGCERDCENCDLLMDSERIIEAYDKAIEVCRAKTY